MITVMIYDRSSDDNSYNWLDRRLKLVLIWKISNMSQEYGGKE